MDEIIYQIKDDMDTVLRNRLGDIALHSDTIATKALKEIQDVLKQGNIVDGNKSDFDIVEEIVCIFEKYDIDTGGCHDF